MRCTIASEAGSELGGSGALLLLSVIYLWDPMRTPTILDAAGTFDEVVAPQSASATKAILSICGQAYTWRLWECATSSHVLFLELHSHPAILHAAGTFDEACVVQL